MSAALDDNYKYCAAREVRDAEWCMGEVMTFISTAQSTM